MAKICITVVGLGAIGTSIGLALTSRKGEGKGADWEIIGHDKEPTAARQAHKAGAVGKTHWNLISACEGADLVVLALPLLAIKDTLKVIGPYLRQDCVVTDTATVKVPVLEWAREFLPETVHFVGGDPIVSTEESGPGAAKAELFQGAVWCIASPPRVASEAIQLVADLVALLGAKPYFMDAAEHDGLLAATDHLPLAVAATLLKVISDSPAHREMTKVGGPLLAQATMSVMSDVFTSRDVCLWNRENLVRWLDEAQEALRQTRELVAKGDEASVETFFRQAQENWSKWVKGEDEGITLAANYRRPSLSEMLFGRLPRLRQPSDDDSVGGKTSRGKT